MPDIATCSCGDLSVTVTTDPYAVVACSCHACQRRSGSPIGVGAYFDRATVTINGKASCFERQVEDRSFRSYFCAACGTTLYWISDLHTDGVGVAVGCFEDSSRYPPQRSVWERSKVPWLKLEQDVEGFETSRKAGRTR